MRRWCSGRRRAQPPARLGDLTSFGTAPRSSPVPSGPSGAVHTSGALLLMCGLVCRLAALPGPAAARVHRRGLVRCDFWLIFCVWLQTSSIGGVFCVDSRSVVTNVVNPTAFSLKIVVFGRRLTTFVTGVLARGFKLLRFDDVCNVVRPPALRPVPAAPSYQKVVRVLDRKLCSG